MNLIQFCANKISRTFYIGTYVTVLLIAALCSTTTTSVYARDHKHSTEQLALKLETDFWTAVVNHDETTISNQTAEIFQGIGNGVGIFTRTQAINAVLSASLKSFAFENLIATRHNSFLVVSFNFVVDPSAGSLQSGPRLHVWKKIDDKWQLVSTSFSFNSLG